MTVKNISNLAASMQARLQNNCRKTLRAGKNACPIGRTYALQLIDHVAVTGGRVVITRKECGGRKELAMLAALA